MPYSTDDLRDLIIELDKKIDRVVSNVETIKDKQEELNKYFSTKWKSNLDQYQYSGWAIVDKIQSNEQVLDVGCGFNEFKSRILNLVGVDPANDCADIKLSIEYFAADNANHNRFDVALCLGSINFGNEINILNQITSVVACLKPQARIYWRCNPGLQDHNNEACKKIEFFPWSFQHHLDYSELFGFTCDILAWDTNNRIYAEWHR